MATLKGSETQANLRLAIGYETLANRRYRAFAERADAEGNPHAAEQFRMIADRRLAHAAGHVRALATPPAAKSEARNLWASVVEKDDGDYPALTRLARDAATEDLALRFETLAKARRIVTRRFRSLAETII